jgi:hypothetical protein
MFHVKQGWALGLQGFSQMGYLSTVSRPWGLQQRAAGPRSGLVLLDVPSVPRLRLVATTEARSGTVQAFLRQAIR